MKIFLIAGEPSGDLLGARLIQALKRRAGSEREGGGERRDDEGREDMSFVGVGGERMTAEGLASLFPMSDLTLFGVAELLPKIPLVLRRIKETAKAIKREKPDVVVTIDAPDFCFRVARRLRGSGIPFVHYVAPTVWAWRPKRAKKIQPLFKHLLTLFPFEPPYFEKVGLAATFVGHPLIDAGIDTANADAFRAKYGIAQNRPILVVLPGSRRSEHAALMDVFAQAIDKLVTTHPEIKVVVPTVPHLFEAVKKRIAEANWKGDPLVFAGDTDKYGAFKAATGALAASGTVALELGLAGTPAVIAYRVHPVTAALYRHFIRTKFANLVNIMANRMVVPEYIQENCTPEHLLSGLVPLFEQPETRLVQKDTLNKVRDWLSASDGSSPAGKAAEVILAIAREQSRTIRG